MDVVDKLLEGSVDLHCHSGPSALPRRFDHVEAAQSAASLRMRAIVVKCHHHCTATDLISMKRELAHVTTEVFGGVALNSWAGGLNPYAVDLCLGMGGRIVWFPTISAGAHIAHAARHEETQKHFAAGVPLMRPSEVDVFGADGDLRPEVYEILRLAKRANAIVSAGHLAPDRALALMDAARSEGLARLIVSHPEYIMEASEAQMLELADSGVVIEHSLCMYYGEHADFPFGDLLHWINLIGPERTALGSDLGQVNEPLPIEAYKGICGQLLDAGVTERELALMVKTNPSRLLGLDG